MTTTTTVPGLRQVGVNGTGFMVDDRPGRGVQRRSVPFLRNQADTGNQPGAQSLNPAGTWRRHESDWSHGAGQSVHDGKESDDRRFRSSKGVKVWDRWKLSLLNDTGVVRSFAGSSRTLVVGDYIYVLDVYEVYRSLDGSTGWTAIGIAAGEGGWTLFGGALATNGYTLYAAGGTNGIHSYVGGGSAVHYNDLNATRLWHVKGRLLAANTNVLYNVTAAGAAPAALYTHPIAGWLWLAAASGPTHIYIGGGPPGRHQHSIYKTTIQPDGTALTIPTVAADLPLGEHLLAMEGYLGYVVILTSAGVRLASIAADGNLTLGSVIPIAGNDGRIDGGLAAYDRFVWFTWPAYDATSSGLGRLDLSEFTAPLTPAYASDLMTAATATVTSVAWFKGRLYFTVTGVGLLQESANKVATGTIDSGDITFDITDDKVAVGVDVAHQPLVGSHGVSLSVDAAAFTSLGTHAEGAEPDNPTFLANEARGERFEIRHTLNRNTAMTDGPTLTRSTVSAYPVPRRPSEVFVVWLLLHTAEALNNGSTVSRDPSALLDSIIALEEAGTVIDFQLGDKTYRALIEDHEFVSEGEPYGSWPKGSVGLTVRAI